jgi:hypothetical protein
MLSRLTFCGRDSQLEELITRWRLASDVENPSPQIVVIKAERGLGKTRLALEFYRWLSTQVDDLDQKCYWPDVLGIVDKNLEVNPDSNNCNFDVPIPYLWWGLRAGDPGSENGVAGDSIATYDRYLGPQLVALLWRARAKDRAWEVFKAVGETGLDLAFSALHVDDIISVAKGVNKIAQILSGVLSGNVDEPALNEAMEASVSRSAAALQAMEKIFTPKTITYAKVAGVIFLDDAQFAHKDAALPTFIEHLMCTAVINR